MTRYFQPNFRRDVSVTALFIAVASLGCSGNGEGVGPGGSSSAGTGPGAGSGSGAVPNGAGQGGAASGGIPGIPGAGTSNGGGPAQQSACTSETLQPSSAPIRRLSRNEFNNTVAVLLGDTTSPGLNLPPEVLGNGFSNDAAQQTVSADLV